MDAECAAEEVCFEGFCTLSCVLDEDCGDGICSSEARDEDVVDVCVADTSVNNDPTGECRFDDDCEALAPGARCDVDGICFFPAFSLLIRDTTTHAGVDDGGAGSDIVAVYLEDPDTNEPVAWADTLQYRPAGGLESSNAPDGTRVPLGAGGTCVDETYEQAATPLGGAGGVLLVQFLEGVTGDTVPTPPSSWNVVIVEWGDNCPGGEVGEPDSFDVFACEAATHKATDPDRDCGSLLQRVPTGGYVEIAAEQK